MKYSYPKIRKYLSRSKINVTYITKICSLLGFTITHIYTKYINLPSTVFLVFLVCRPRDTQKTQTDYSGCIHKCYSLHSKKYSLQYTMYIIELV